MDFETLQNQLQEAIKCGRWGLVGAISIMITVMISYRMFGRYIQPEIRPLAASFIGIIVTIVAFLQVGVSPWNAMLMGVILGTSAGGHWSLWGRYVAEHFGWKDFGSVGDDKPK